MANINEQITACSFETVRDLIGSILAVELANQVQYDSDANIKVWSERERAFDKTELPAINVTVSEMPITWQTSSYGTGELTINIDCHAIAQADVTEAEVLTHGDKKSRVLMEKMCRWVFKIIQHGSYQTLGLNPNTIIEGVEVKKIYFPLFENADTENTTFGRVELGIRVHESTNNFVATGTAELLNTEIKLSETEFGYYWTINN